MNERTSYPPHPPVGSAGSPRGRAAALALALTVGVVLAGCAGSASTASTTTPADTLLPIQGTRLFVHTEGSGAPVLVVHGGPVLDHGYLVEPLRPLAASHRLVFYDQRLSGRSAGVVDSASVRLETFVEDIEAIRSELGLGRVHLVGHSWGGLLAMLYATRHADRLRSLILLDPLPPSSGLWREEQRAQAAAVEPEDTAGMGALRSTDAFRNGDPAAVLEMLRLSFRGQFHDPTMARRLDFHIEPDYRSRSAQFGYLGAELAAFDLRGELASLRVPTLVVYGQDEVGPGIGGSELARTLPDATVATIPDAGHFPFLERPEAFLRTLRAFLDEAGG